MREPINLGRSARTTPTCQTLLASQWRRTVRRSGKGLVKSGNTAAQVCLPAGIIRAPVSHGSDGAPKCADGLGTAAWRANQARASTALDSSHLLHPVPHPSARPPRPRRGRNAQCPGNATWRDSHTRITLPTTSSLSALGRIQAPVHLGFDGAPRRAVAFGRAGRGAAQQEEAEAAVAGAQPEERGHVRAVARLRRPAAPVACAWSGAPLATCPLFELLQRVVYRHASVVGAEDLCALLHALACKTMSTHNQISDQSAAVRQPEVHAISPSCQHSSCEYQVMNNTTCQQRTLCLNTDKIS